MGDISGAIPGMGGMGGLGFDDLGELNPFESPRIAALTGQTGAEASLEAARMQTELGYEGIDTQREFLDRMLSQTEPFQQLGLGQADNLNQLLNQGFDRSQLDRAEGMIGQPNQAQNRLNQLLTDPSAQASFIQDNPFYQQMAGDTTNRLMSNAAAQGKAGSGGTAAALQDRLVGMGSDLLNREISQLASGAGLNQQFQNQDIQNLVGLSGQNNQLTQNQFGNTMQTVGLGANAAAGQGSGIQNTGSQITNLLTGIGNAQAAGGMGAANAYGQGASNVAGIAGAIGSFFSDRAVKQDIEQVGEITTDKGTYPTYTFRYIWDDQQYLGVMSDDVREINPDAVSNRFGLDVVNYAEL